MALRHLFAAALTLQLAACGLAASEAQPEYWSVSELEAFAGGLQLRHTWVRNLAEGECPAPLNNQRCFVTRLNLRYPIDAKLRDWTLYFSAIDPISTGSSEYFRVEHLNGDLHRVQPLASFGGFVAQRDYHIDLYHGGTLVSAAKFMPNYFLEVAGVGQTRLSRTLASSRYSRDLETGLEMRPHVGEPDIPAAEFVLAGEDQTQLATAGSVFAANADAQLWTESLRARELETAVLPTPRVLQRQDGMLSLKTGVRLSVNNGEVQMFDTAMHRLALLGLRADAQGVPLQIDLPPADAKAAAVPVAGEAGSEVAEHYQLQIDAAGIRIQARHVRGAYYALQTLAALMQPGHDAVPYLRIDDGPRFAFRGVHVDVARNFLPPAFFQRLFAQMAAYKLNVLHLHLADDEGWRLAIPDLPELTAIGARRCHDPDESRCLLPQLGAGAEGAGARDGFFSREQYIQLLREAARHHIRVIPSLDMPGHSRAAIRAMDARYRTLLAAGDRAGAETYLLSDPADRSQYRSIQYYTDNTLNVCMESTYTFVAKVLQELQAMHSEAAQPLTRYHIGADETAGAWTASPACQRFLASNKFGVTRIDQLGGHFIARVARMLEQRGVAAAAWSDGLDHVPAEKLPANVQSNIWSQLGEGAHKIAHRHANRGWPVVLSLPDALYFDFPYEAAPFEHGNVWAARRIDERKVFEFMPENLPAHAGVWTDSFSRPLQIDDRPTADHQPLQRGRSFAGMQGHLWTETVRSVEQAEYLLYPRLLALAERAWHRAGWEVPYRSEGARYGADSGHFDAERRAARGRDWWRFAQILGGKELAKLERSGVFWRLPLVGAVIRDGRVQTNLALPGLRIDWQDRKGNWQPVGATAPASAEVKAVRALTPGGRRAGRAWSP